MRQIAASLTILLCIAGCTSSSAPVSTGKIFGTTYLQNADYSLATSSAGVLVEALGTNHKAVSDSLGHWELTDMPAGYYMLRFSKEGFNHFITNVAFLGTGVLNTDYLGGQLMRLSTSNITITPPTKISKNGYGPDTSYVFYINTPVIDSGAPAPQSLRFAWFIGKTPVINYLDSTTYIMYTSSSSDYAPAFYSNKLRSGDTIYVMAYYLQSMGGNLTYQYDDGETTKTEFFGFGKPSNVVQVVLP